jgi:hypothetical protein
MEMKIVAGDILRGGRVVCTYLHYVRVTIRDKNNLSLFSLSTRVKASPTK